MTPPFGAPPWSYLALAIIAAVALALLAARRSDGDLPD